MKKHFIISGTLLILIGLIFISSFNTPKEVSRQSHVQLEDQWTISWDFMKGEFLSVGFWPHYSWSYPLYDDHELYGAVKYVAVNVTNTNTGNYTLFKVTIGPPYGYTLEPPYDFTLCLIDIEVYRDHGALIVDAKPKEIGGFVRDNGVYNITCALLPGAIQYIDLEGKQVVEPAPPPALLRLTKVTIEEAHPYRFLLPTGIAIMIIGTVVSALGVRLGNKSRRKYRIT